MFFPSNGKEDFADAMLKMRNTREDLTQRLKQLGGIVKDCEGLWRPAPFHHEALPWVATHPALHASLLGLDDAQVDALHRDEQRLRNWLERYIPGMASLNGLVELADLTKSAAGVGKRETGERMAHAPGRDVPGRKWFQIEAFAGLASAQSRDADEVLDWCSGKAHLGRLIGMTTGLPVRALERDPALCVDAERLAERDGISLKAEVCDVLGLRHRHVLGPRTLACALHACGDLHLTLLDQALLNAPAGLLLAPCCYHRTAQEVYRPRSAAGQGCNLHLGREDLRLAVLETVTAGHGQREAEKCRKARLLALKDWGACHGLGIGDYALLKDLGRGEDAPALIRACERLGWPVPTDAQIAPSVQAGWRRAREVRALELIRTAIRRPLEVWLVLDMALGLEAEGYEVEVGTFCGREITPRNLLIRAVSTSR